MTATGNLRAEFKIALLPAGEVSNAIDEVQRESVYEASQQTEIVVRGDVALVQASKANHVPAVPKTSLKPEIHLPTLCDHGSTFSISEG